jgi:hypothetical protein
MSPPERGRGLIYDPLLVWCFPSNGRGDRPRPTCIHVCPRDPRLGAELPVVHTEKRPYLRPPEIQWFPIKWSRDRVGSGRGQGD